MLAISAGFPRSGRPLLISIMSNIVTSTGSGQAHISLEGDHNLRAWADASNVIVTKMREWTPGLDMIIKGGSDVRAVLIVRDIRDVVYHLMTDKGRSFGQVVGTRAYTGYAANYYQWSTRLHDDKLMVIRLEDMIGDGQGSVLQIAEFMGVTIDSDAANHLADLTLGPLLSHLERMTGLYKKALTGEQIAVIEEDSRPWLVLEGYKLSD